MIEPVYFELRHLPPTREAGWTPLREGLLLRRLCVICERDMRRAVVVTRKRDSSWFTICVPCARDIADAVEDA